MPVLTVPKPPVQIPDFLPPILESRSHGEIPKLFIRAFFQNGFDMLPKKAVDMFSQDIHEIMEFCEPADNDYLLM